MTKTMKSIQTDKNYETPNHLPKRAMDSPSLRAQSCSFRARPGRPSRTGPCRSIGPRFDRLRSFVRQQCSGQLRCIVQSFDRLCRALLR